VVLDDRGCVLACNRAYSILAGASCPKDVIGHCVTEWLAPAHHANFWEFIRNTPAGIFSRAEVSYVLPDGRRPLVLTEVIVRSSLIGRTFTCSVKDVTDKRNAEFHSKLCESALESSSNAIAICRLDGSRREYVYINPAYEQLTGFDLAEVNIKSPNGGGEVRRLLDEVRANGHAHAKLDTVRKDGRVITRSVHLSRITRVMDDGEYLVSVSADVTQAERIAETLRLQSRAIEASQNGLMIVRANGAENPIVMVNSAFERITGYSTVDVLGKDVRLFQDRDRNGPERAHIRAAMNSGSSVSVVMEHRRKDDRTFWYDLRIDPVRDEAGIVTHFIGVINDVTAQRESAAKMQQMEKLNAIGQLTGGIAHDFNNLLAVVLGNLSLLQDAIISDDQRRRVALALSAAKRGTELVRRLSAYSRTQQLREERLQVNDLITDMEPLLTSTIGEHITVRVHLCAEAWPIRIDRNQLETAVLNLAINARDAMTGGGKLTLTTQNVTLAQGQTDLDPGDYLLLSLTDTGAGMSREVRERAVEPFFTTKEVGRGTGLGLSSVYGFVKQSKGHLVIHSELGCGTSIELYLPRDTSVPSSPEPSS
jgi:PAS domain S-box-containing protein